MTLPLRKQLLIAPLIFLLALAVEAGEIDLLIEQLGSDKFAVREAAEKKLEKIGEPAVPALQKASRNSDLELRLRAVRIIETIRFGGQRAVKALGGEFLDGEDAEGKRFVSVNLSGTRATDADMVYLKWFDRIDALNLSRTQVTDAGLPSLGMLTHLQRLSLTGTPLTGISGGSGCWPSSARRSTVTDLLTSRGWATSGACTSPTAPSQTKVWLT
jgi:hypothetical protein